MSTSGYKKRVTCHSRENKIFQGRSSDFNCTIFLLEHEKDVGRPYLDDLVPQKPQYLLVPLGDD